MRYASKWRRWRRHTVAAAALLAMGAGSASGQAQAGNLYGTCLDTDGDTLPGVTVTLLGLGPPRVELSEAKGEFRFLGLAPGSYVLQAALDGFSTVEHPHVVVHVGRNTSVEVELDPVPGEILTVSSQSPLLDARKISTGATVSQAELQGIPSARDPWALLGTVPGVQTDRVNVGGNESGQQANFAGPGSSSRDAVWAIDGVVITDMSWWGSPTYYNFDAFEEIQVETGGSDVALTTGGVTLNLVTRRGTNEWRASARYLVTDEAWQSGLSFDPSELGEGQASFQQGNRIVSVEDYGVEGGGPMVREKLWIWANYGRNDIDLLTIADVSDFTTLEDTGAKLNAQWTRSNSSTAFYNHGDKIKIGRGAGPTRPKPTTWNQDGPTDIYKLEDAQVFAPSFYLSGMASVVDQSFQLTPQGGPDGPPTTLDENFVWQNNFFQSLNERPQRQIRLDGSYFFHAKNTGHELKFGVGYRRAETRTASLWPGGGVRLDYYRASGYDYNVFVAARAVQFDADSRYDDAYAQDTVTVAGATINVGLRYDRQGGASNPVKLPGVPGFETRADGTPLLPAVTVPGVDPGFQWSDLMPRLGVTYAVGARRSTLLRASYSRFAEQLTIGPHVLHNSPATYSYAYFYYEDLNNDRYVTVDEIIDFAAGPLWTNHYDPLQQTALNRTDPGLRAGRTDELLLGVEHAVSPEFLLGATLILRRKSNVEELERLVQDGGVIRPQRRDDYVFAGTRSVVLPDGSAFDVPVYRFRDGLEDVGGFLLTNGEREWGYQGLSLTAHKRLSDRWMLRGNLTFAQAAWDVPESEREDPIVYLGGGYDDGGPVLFGSATGAGQKGGVYIGYGWSYSATGLVQVAPRRKWGFHLAAAVHGRQGYPIPYFLRVPRTFVTGNDLQATEDADDFRHDDVHLLDLRLEKELVLQDASLTLSLELFNAANTATVLQRQHRLGIPGSGYVTEVLSPRVLRLGARWRWR